MAPRFAIIKHDDPPRQQTPDWRNRRDVVYPETYPYRQGPASTGWARRRFSVARTQAHILLNPGVEEESMRETNYIINRGPGQQVDWQEVMALDPDASDNPEMPQFEFLTTGGNFTEVLEVRARRGVRVKTYALQDAVPVPQVTNIKTDPILTQKFTAIHPDGHIYNIFDQGKDAYFYAVAPAEAWLPFEQVEFFPELGEVSITIREGLNIRNAPDIASEKLGKLEFGRKVQVQSYFPTMGNVWGLTAVGYIALRYQPAVGFNFHYQPTTWQLQTPGTLRPRSPLPGELPTYTPGAEPDPKPLSNQGVINAFQQAFGWAAYWLKVVEALPGEVVTGMLANRSAAYSGPLLYQMNLSADDKRLLQVELLRT